MAERLPVPGSDDSTWGTILNGYLSVDHAADGTHKSSASLLQPLAGSNPIHFNVCAYGAVGDGVTHPLSAYFATLTAAQAVYPHATALTNEIDWAALQAAVNRAAALATNCSGVVFLPAPPAGGFYRLNVTTDYHPASGTLGRLDIECEAWWAGVRWVGANGSDASHYQVVFRIRGMAWSKWSGLQVWINGGAYVCAFELDQDGSYPSLSNNVFERVNFTIDTSEGAYNIGWRIGHSSNGVGADSSQNTWLSCNVKNSGGLSSDVHTGWVWEHGNVLACLWQTCGTTKCGFGWTNTPTAGAAGVQGGASMAWVNCGSSANVVDLSLKCPGPYSSINGRWELGVGHHLEYTQGVGALVPILFTEIETQVNEITPADNIVFSLAGAAYLWIQGGDYHNAVAGAFTAAFITGNANAASYSKVKVTGAMVRGPGTAPTGATFCTLGTGHWTKEIDALLVDSSGSAVGTTTV